MMAIQASSPQPRYTLYRYPGHCRLEIISEGVDGRTEIATRIDKKGAVYIAEELRLFIQASNRIVTEKEE